MPEIDPEKAKKKKKMLIFYFSLFLILAAAIFFLWWFVLGRFEETTSDAYVHGNMVEITPQIPGFVSDIYVQETDFVKQNQPLVSLDVTDQKLAFERSKARLGEIVRAIVGNYDEVNALYAEWNMAKAKYIRARQDYDHRKNLIQSGGVSLENYEHSVAELRVAYSNVKQIKYDFKKTLALVQNTSLAMHPMVISAKEEVKQAYVNLKRCQIVSPVDGIVAQRKVQVGESISPQDALLAVIPVEQIWVNANFKETQLKNIRIGQSVKITADMYGDSVVFQGTVEGINPGTGSVFSVLPPQNATGNWIKIVQRLPVRVRLEEEQIRKFPLWLGVSMHVKVNTTDRAGKKIAEPLKEETPIYQTDVFSRQIKGIESVIDQIIQQNVPENFPVNETFSFSFDE